MEGDDETTSGESEGLDAGEAPPPALSAASESALKRSCDRKSTRGISGAIVFCNLITAFIVAPAILVIVAPAPQTDQVVRGSPSGGLTKLLCSLFFPSAQSPSPRGPASKISFCSPRSRGRTWFTHLRPRHFELLVVVLPLSLVVRVVDGAPVCGQSCPRPSVGQAPSACGPSRASPLGIRRARNPCLIHAYWLSLQVRAVYHSSPTPHLTRLPTQSRSLKARSSFVDVGERGTRPCCVVW